MTDDIGGEPVMGGYVHTVSYKMMRLRMLICGTAGPTDDELMAGLDRLLEHLKKYPLPES